ncbi:MAG: tetratricopeptide repeat protein [Microcoleaceae cyanobacterium]
MHIFHLYWMRSITTTLLLILMLTVGVQLGAIAETLTHDHHRVPAFDYPYLIPLERIESEQFLNEGLSKVHQQDFLGAIASLTRATEIDPTYEAAYRYLGDIYCQVGDSDAAIAAYSHALEYNPFFSRLYNSRGEVYLASQDYDQAIADFTKAIEVYPEDPIGYYNRGHAYYDLKRYPQAIYDLWDAIRIDSTSAEAHIIRGKVRKALDSAQGAIADYKIAAALLHEQSEQMLEQNDMKTYQQLQNQLQTVVQDVKALSDSFN